MLNGIQNFISKQIEQIKKKEQKTLRLKALILPSLNLTKPMIDDIQGMKKEK